MKDDSVRHRQTAQGYADESAWSRGQAWAIYGFAVCYRETGNRAYLDQALKTFNFMKNHPLMPKDLIPFWDMDAPKIPNEPRDVSSASCIASALYMKKILISILSMAFTISLNASDYRFEDKVPNTFSVVKGSDLSLSDIYFKDGKKSLKWTWISSSPLSVSDLTLNKAASSSKGGITLWIYNEKPIADMLQFTFETAKGDKTYSFNFNLSYKGWRACSARLFRKHQASHRLHALHNVRRRREHV